MYLSKLILANFIFLVGIAITTSSQDEELNVNWSKIFSGEVVVEPVENSDGLPSVRAMFSVSSSRDNIWKVLLDYEHFPEIFDGIIEMKVRKQDENGALVEFRVDAVLKNLHYVLYRHYEDPKHKLTWKRDSGDMQKIEGSWRILDTPRSGIKLLIYDSYIKLGGLG